MQEVGKDSLPKLINFVAFFAYAFLDIISRFIESTFHCFLFKDCTISKSNCIKK